MRILLLALSPLFLLPVLASALGGGQVAELESPTLGFGGEGLAEGALAGIKLHSLETDWAPADAQSLVAQAESRKLEVDVYRYEAEYGLIGATVQPPPRSSYYHDHYHYSGATFTTASPYSLFELVLIPLEETQAPRLEIEAVAGSLVPSTDEQVQGGDWAGAQDRDGLSASTSGAVQLEAWHGLSRLKVTGSFQLSLWYWDVAVTGAEQGEPQEFWTGRRQTTVVADPAMGTEGIQAGLRYQQVILTVHDGAFELANIPDAPALVRWSALQVSALTLEFDEAAGTLLGADGEVLLERNHVKLSGDLSSALDATEHSSLFARVTGHLATSSVDDQAIPVPSLATAPPPWEFPLLWTSIAVALPASAWGARSLTRLRERRRMDALEDLAQAGDDASVVRLARDLEGSRSFRHDAAALKVDALVRLGRLDEADEFTRSLTGWTGPAAAVLDYLIAVVASHRNEPDRARTHLLQSLSRAPELAGEAATQPAFGPLLHDSQVRIALRGRAVADAPEGYN